MSEYDGLARAILARASSSLALTQASQYMTSPPGAAYRDWTFGGSAKALPRDALEFLDGAFGPSLPRDPLAIDVPHDGLERPEPRRFEYPVGWNLMGGKPGTEGLKLATYMQLRAFADMSSMVRAAIEVRKQEILGIEWEIVPTREARARMKEDESAQGEWIARKDEATRFFKRPDPEYQNYHAWMSAFLEDLFVVDAGSLYLHPPRVAGRGVLGSNLAALEIIDGTTIRPMLDMRGGKPPAPNPAYQQFIWGVPRSELMSVILGSDMDGMPGAEPIATYRGDQLLYLPYIRRSWTPYGFPGIERALLPVVTGLKKQQFALEFFTEGTIPGMFVVPGPGIDTPEQIRKLQDTLNFLAGDQAWKHKIIVLPHGSSTDKHKPIELATSYDETVAVEICMAYEVNPSEVGYPMGMHQKGLSIGGSAHAAEVGDESRQRKATKPLLRWLSASVFNFILQDVLQQPDMEWSWVGWQDEDDLGMKSERMLKEVASAARTIDEYRTEVGMDPFGLPLTNEPILISTRDGGVTPIAYLDAQKLADQFNDPAAHNEQASEGGGSKSGASTSSSSSGSDDEGDSKKIADALDELEKLRRFIKKGKSARDWTPVHLSTEIVARIAEGLEIAKARTMIRALPSSEGESTLVPDAPDAE